MSEFKDRRFRTRLLDGDAGSTSIEYATLFGVVVICLIVGVYCLGQISKSSFNMTAAAVNGGMLDSPDATGVPNSDGALAGPTGQDASPSWHFLALGAAFLMACIAPLTYIAWKSRREKKKKSKQEATQDHEIAEAPTAEQQAFQKRQEIRRVFQNEMASLLDGHLKVRQIMSRQLTCVRKSDTVQSIHELMALKKIRYVIVCEKDGQLVGIISQSDCDTRSGKRAVDIMTPNPVSLDVNSDLAPAITTLVSRRISCLPITSQGKLEGVLTTTDFLMALQCALQTLANVAKHFSAAKRPSPVPAADRGGRLPSMPAGTLTTDAVNTAV